MTIGLLTHGAAAYVVSNMGWPVVDQSRTVVADPIVLVFFWLFFGVGWLFHQSPVSLEGWEKALSGAPYWQRSRAS
jgi:hypothetical protein